MALRTAMLKKVKTNS